MSVPAHQSSAGRAGQPWEHKALVGRELAQGHFIIWVNLPGSFLRLQSCGYQPLFTALASLLITSNPRADSPDGGQSPGVGRDPHQFEEKGEGETGTEGWMTRETA